MLTTRCGAARRGFARWHAVPDWMFLTAVDGHFVGQAYRNISKAPCLALGFLGDKHRDLLPPRAADLLMRAWERASRWDAHGGGELPGVVIRGRCISMGMGGQAVGMELIMSSAPAPSTVAWG